MINSLIFEPAEIKCKGCGDTATLRMPSDWRPDPNDAGLGICPSCNPGANTYQEGADPGGLKRYKDYTK